MNDDNAALCNKTDRLPRQLRQKLLGWSGHILSWLDQSDIPVHLVRYEDLRSNPVRVLRRALEFAQLFPSERNTQSCCEILGFRAGSAARTKEWFH
jgi:hypothetical protein